MAKIQLTLFNAKESNTKAKVAVSKYKDESFTFVTVEFPSLATAYQYITNEFVLSQPLNLNINEPTSLVRDKVSLTPYKYPRLKNIILDLDKIHTVEDYEDTIEYFKNKKYSCILGKSRSWNGKDVFNMKGIIRIDIENEEEVIEAVLTQLQVELGDKCKIDQSMKQVASYQAPTHSKMMVYTHENGKKLTSEDIYIKDVKEILNKAKKNKEREVLDITYNNEIIDECIKIFYSMGYTPIRGSLQEDGAINFQHPIEKKSIGSFFWFSSQPMVMNHPNKSRTISIFNVIKDTPIGKKWLKKKTKLEQKRQLIKDNTHKYLEYKCYDERYLDFSDESKIQIIDNFINSEENEVLKIKSPMGTAKSNGIKLCIDKAHEKGLKVILISNRVSVAMDFTKKYNMMWYKDPDSWKQDQSMIVQFDSLHKFDIEKYDIVILDEFVSLLFHHKGNLTNNANINIVKFKIFMEKKKVLVADAFLTGFEDIFFRNRKIRMIDNNYRDDIKLIKYSNKEHFASALVTKALELKKNNKKMSCSFTSNNVMKAIYHELKIRNIKVIMLNAETPEYTKNIIYKQFELQEHNAYDVILYSPTLTVGVSNLNNIDDHFHFDSGMSIDVNGSLQMIKRSRRAKTIHYFLEERQFYYDTDIKSINSTAETNINTFYNNKDSTLLIDIDYNTGKLKLTELGKYVNKIEAFSNITKNNHANAFDVLLEHQVSNKPIINDDIEVIFNLKETIKTIKEKEKQDKLKVLSDWENKDFSSIDIERLRTKAIELTKDEKMELLCAEIQEKFSNKLEDEELLYIAKQQIDTNFKYMGYISKLRIARKAFASRDYAKYLLSQTISSDISSLQNKSWINFLEYISLLSSVTKLKKSYSENDIKVMDDHFQVGRKFKKFLKIIGYKKKKGDARYRQDEKIFEFSKKI